MPSETARVVIDCDPGRDDALAILAVLGCERLQLDFISTVAGNVSIERAASNALGVLAVAGVDDIPVYVGAARPLEREFKPGSDLHGDMAEGEPRLPAITVASAGPAGPALRRWCREPADLPKRLVAIGPLTNIASLLRDDADALAAVDDLFVMGGTVGQLPTRASPTAEFNFYTDPEAADLVLRSGARVWLYDYDATTGCQIPTQAVSTIARAFEPRIGRHVEGWLNHLWAYANRVYGREGIAVHDLYAAAGAAGISPGRWDHYEIAVSTTADRRGTVEAVPADEGRGIAVARDLDVDAMIEFLLESGASLTSAES